MNTPLLLQYLQHGSTVKTVIFQAIAQAPKYQYITCTSAYFDYMTEANTTDSQKMEDHDITDKLLLMLLATAKMLQMQ
jgi:hypothetical protein